LAKRPQAAGQQTGAQHRTNQQQQARSGHTDLDCADRNRHTRRRVRDDTQGAYDGQSRCSRRPLVLKKQGTSEKLEKGFDMTQLSTLGKQEGFGVTARRDAWWVGPSLTVIGLSAFLIYGTWAAWQGDHFEIRRTPSGRIDWEHGRPVAPYLSPFFPPPLYDPISPHAWFQQDWKANLGLPGWFPFSAGLLILAFPGLFRLTCYYYRKAYYRSFWADPPA